MSDAESINRLNQGHTLSPETRRALLLSSLSTRAPRRDRLFGPVCAILIAAFLVWWVMA